MQNRQSNELADVRSARSRGITADIEVVQFRVDLRTRGTHMVLWPRGGLCDDSVPALAEALDRVFDLGFRHLLVDLSDVDLLSAAGVSLLMEARRRCHGNGGTLNLANPSQMAQRVLDVCEVPLAHPQPSGSDRPGPLLTPANPLTTSPVVHR